MEQQRVNSVIGEAHTASEKVVVCSYPQQIVIFDYIHNIIGSYSYSVLDAQVGAGESKAEASRTEQ